MPVTYAFTGRLITLTPAGEYPDTDVLRMAMAAVEDPACPKDPRLLLDVRESSMLAGASKDRIIAVSRAFREVAPHVGGRCAVLTGSLLQYGLARMGAGFAQTDGRGDRRVSGPGRSGRVAGD